MVAEELIEMADVNQLIIKEEKGVFFQPGVWFQPTNVAGEEQKWNT